MSINCTVVNKNGDEYHVTKPCFGFMSYIHIWGNDDDGDWDDGERYHKPGFESHDLQSMIYNANLFSGMSWTPKEKSKMKEVLLKAIESLPQLYGNCTVSSRGDNNFAVDFSFDLPDQPMDRTICAAMMIRNVSRYTSCFQAVQKMVELGANPAEAFVIGNAFFYTNSFNGNYFYRSTGNDESLFNNKATVADLKNIIDGGIGNCWQGNWGDTVRGYQRYGELEDKDDAYADPDSAPADKRTGRSMTLNTCMIIADPELVKTSPTLTRVDNRQGFGDSANRFDDEYMKQVLKLLRGE